MIDFQRLPTDFSQTRASLHQIAFFALSPARYRAVGRMGLRATPGGFGTPPYDGVVDRVEGGLLVHETTEGVATATITTVRDASRFFGGEYQVDWFTDFKDPLTPTDPDRPLPVGDAAARALASWFEFGFDVLGAWGRHGDEEDEVTEVQLWPEHFDPALEMGVEARGGRASYGCSPGDPTHDEPYVYVAAWSQVDRSNAFWNDGSFNGASLGFDALSSASDPEALVLEFFERGYRLLDPDGE
ncbi:MAG: hypothetical protein WB245_05190 [Acidimicrobiia bacterium]